ncbi:hypothetical protein [Novosphingobium sp. ST904]|uniref:hypothetical protein n=1 Tax=Novosphingobium sp. ST904 TaxID=1684385 RepID=UPI0006C86F4D|nr:hypothetical protein [Novosphingobium sp. ST904]TCM37743.1 hypothetical protein EDF59_110139 [Novosphingobium sp. ST904]
MNIAELAKAAADATVPEDGEGFSREKWYIARDSVLFAGQSLLPTPAADEVEAVAKAIHRARFPETYTAHEDYWQQLSDSGREKWFHVARAAIAALQARSAEPVQDRHELDATMQTADRLARRMGGRFVPHAAEPAGEEPVACCKECGSTGLTWFAHSRNKSQVVEGRLKTSDVECLFVLGCEACSETLRVATTDEVAALLSTGPTPSNPHRLVEAFVASLTNNGRNRDTMLSINHDELRALVAKASAAQDQGGES